MKTWAIIVLVLGAFAAGFIIGFFVGFFCDAIIYFGVQNEIIGNSFDRLWFLSLRL